MKTSGIFFLRPVRLLLFLFCLTATVAVGFGQTYSANLDDIKQPGNKITPIGDLGNLEQIIDLRGFIPLSLVSKTKSDYQEKSIFNFFTDRFQWYQIPTPSGVSLLYYGDSDDATLKKLAKTKLIDEKGLAGDNQQWAKFAYELSRSSGSALFKVAGGSRGLDSSEPVAILFTARTAIILMNFKYTDVDRKGTGQIICAFEFSRALKEYKTFYDLYSTTAFSRSTKEAFDTSAPYVTKFLQLYFSVGL